MDKKPKAVVLLGPTASGKTATAILLAKQFNGEVINLDSVQFYKGLDIGSAKPSADELGAVKHHLVNIAEPDEQLNAFQVFKKAMTIGKELSAAGKLPVYSGGTGLYFKALFYGMFEGPDRDEAFRALFRKEVETLGLSALYERLKQIDPDSASKISPNDPVRIERALEVYHLTGRTMSEHRKEQQFKPEFDYIKIGLEVDRAELYARIEKRIDNMLEQGLLKEVQSLLHKYPASHILHSAIGYAEAASFLQGEIDHERMVYLLKRNTRRFAKRQLTLFRQLEGIRWFLPEDINKIIEFIGKEILMLG